MPYPKTLENAIGNVMGPNASLIVEGSLHKIDPAPQTTRKPTSDRCDTAFTPLRPRQRSTWQAIAHYAPRDGKNILIATNIEGYLDEGPSICIIKSKLGRFDVYWMRSRLV